MRTLILAGLTVLLTACSNLGKKLPDVNLDYSDETTQSSCYVKIIGDSVEIPYFEIELNLSNKAEEKLKTDNETVIVMAYFDGIANMENIPDKYKDRAGFGRLHLLSYPIELTDKRLARFENIRFSKDLYDLLESKEIMVLINVFSGRKSTNDNLLDVDILEGSMSDIKEKRFTLNGKLIYYDN